MSIVPSAHFIYTVHSGDTLYTLASRFASSVEAIARANHLGPPVMERGMIIPGQILVIPRVVTQRGWTLYVVKPGDTLYAIAVRYSTHADLLAGINPALRNRDLIYPGQQLLIPALIYEVASGDSLYSIAKRFGVPLTVITQANQGRPAFSPNLIWPGYRLIIPLPSTQNIAVFDPYPGSVIRSGQQLHGWARAFEGNVLHQVFDSNGVVVSGERSTTTSAGAPSYGKFTSTLSFDREPTSSFGAIWVYTRSAKDGSMQDVVQLKVYFPQ